MKPTLTLALALVLADMPLVAQASPQTGAAAPTSVEARRKALEALIAEQWEYNLSRPTPSSPRSSATAD